MNTAVHTTMGKTVSTRAAQKLWTTNELLDELGYRDADKKRRKAIESRLYNLRMGETQRAKRADGSYRENPVVIPPRLIEGKHWRKEFGKVIVYTEAGRRLASLLIARGDV